MSQTQSPLLPTQSDTPDGRRLLTGLTELVRNVMSAGVFLTRPTLERLLIPRVGEQVSLRWGALNRVTLTVDTDMYLPRMRPESVGVPLELVKLTAAHTITLLPSGRGLQGQTQPTINGASAYAFTSIGLYVLKHDGQNWFTAP